MQTINFQGKTVKISKRQIDIMQIVKGCDFVAPKGLFEIGRGRNTNNLISASSDAELDFIKVKDHYTDRESADLRVRKFSEKNRRHHFVIIGDRRRINAILKKVKL
tara:strand:+ start:2374 stop:2691 length:318 start_codon:yes stop_codon:yes gene_type:complete